MKAPRTQSQQVFPRIASRGIRLRRGRRWISCALPAGQRRSTGMAEPDRASSVSDASSVEDSSPWTESARRLVTAPTAPLVAAVCMRTSRSTMESDSGVRRIPIVALFSRWKKESGRRRNAREAQRSERFHSPRTRWPIPRWLGRRLDELELRSLLLRLSLQSG